jgi:putative ABC transport system permease protein
MISHWLRVIWRTLRADPVYATICIVSLAIGCAGALLIGGYLREELTYDHWLPDSDHIVRLETTFAVPGRNTQQNTSAPSGVGFLLTERVPGLEALVRISPQPPLNVRTGETVTSIQVQFVDPSFLRVIELPLAEGDPVTALSEPSGIVISPQTRDQLFGDGPALGQTVTLSDRDAEAVVTGVIGELPRNSQFRKILLLASHQRPLKPPPQTPPAPPAQPGQPAPPPPPPQPAFDETFFFNDKRRGRAGMARDAATACLGYLRGKPAR